MGDEKREQALKELRALARAIQDGIAEVTECETGTMRSMPGNIGLRLTVGVVFQASVVTVAGLCGGSGQEALDL